MSNNKTEKIIQNDDDWLKWRLEGLGASDAPIFIEVSGINFSKYKTRKELLQEKITREVPVQTNTFITDLGHRVEPICRQITEMNMSFKCGKDITFPATCAKSDDLTFMQASLDGFSKELDLPWECKLIGRDKFNKIKAGGTTDDFLCQTQHQMYVTGKEEVLLTGLWLQFDKKKPVIDYKEIANVYIKRDDDFINNILIPQAKKFWDEVLEGREKLKK